MFTELFNLEGNQFRIGVATPMVLDKESVCLALPAVGHLPPRRFGYKEDGTNDNDTSQALQNYWNSPRVITLDIVCRKSDRSGGDRSAKPSAIQQT